MFGFITGGPNWLMIVAKIIIWIAKGMTKDEAVQKAAAQFNVSEDKIWRHGGF